MFAAWQKGEDSQQAVAEHFAVSESFVRDLSALHRQSGDVVARPHGGGRPALAGTATLECLQGQVAAYNDHTIAEHQQSLAAAGHPMSAATAGRLLLKRRLTRKKRRSKTTKRRANG